MKLCLILALLLVVFLETASLGQSGRSRNPAPPQPAPKPGKQPDAVPVILNLPEGGKVVRYDADGATSRYHLKNGLTVVIRERHSLPLAVVTTYIRAGLLNEPDETSGLARLMEKMLFRGTSTRTASAIASETGRLGGVFGSETSYEKTSFYAIAPVESISRLLAIQADILQNPALDPEEMKRAAQTVIQEKRSELDDPIDGSMDRMFATAFLAHRLRRPRFGEDGFLQSATREQLQNYYLTFYRPENTVLVIVGDIATSQVIGQVQQLYANFGSRPAPEPPPETGTAAAKGAETTVVAAAMKDATATRGGRNSSSNPEPVAARPPAAQAVPLKPALQFGPEEPVQDKLRYSNVRGDVGQTVITIGNHAAPLTKTPEGLREQASLDVLAAVLGRGSGARLNQVLNEKNSIVSSVTAEYRPFPATGIFAVQMLVAPDRIDRAEGEYFREIERFRRELLGEGELQRARIMLEKDFYDRTASIQDEAEQLARWQGQFGDFKLLDSYLDRIQAVTAKEIQQAASKYFILGNTTVHEFEPRAAAPRTFVPEKFAEAIAILAPGTVRQITPEDIKPAVALKQFAQGRERSLGVDGEKVIFVPLPLPVKDFSIYRGPRAFVREDRSQPRITVGLYFQGGRLVEDQNNSGATELMLRSMLKSTMTRKGDLIALELESYGAQISILNEPDFFGFTLDVLSRNAEKALAILVDIVENPYFDAREVAHEKELLLARQLQQRDDRYWRTLELATTSVFPGHPYGLPRFGLATSVRTMTDESLDAWYKRTIKRQFPTIVLIGDTDGSSLVSTAFADAFKRGSGDLDTVVKVNLAGPASETRDLVEQRSRRQTAQVLAFRAPAAQPNPFALAILTSYAAGPGGRLQTELCDKPNLGCDLALSYQPRFAGGLMAAYLTASPENESGLRDALLQQMQMLLTTPPTDEEWERGRNRAIGSYAVALQSNVVRVQEYARAVMMGRKVTDVDNQPDLVRAVKKEEVRATLESLLKSRGRGVVRGQ